MNEDQIKEKLDNAIKNLFKNQEDIFEFTEESGAIEWNLAHHLAFEIQKEFPDYQHDIELTKSSSNYRRPDVFIHRRGTHYHNLLVVELKYQRSIDDDIEKIEDHWFRSPLYYKFGAAIRINTPTEFDIVVLKNQIQINR